jgi:hypothetical protein
MAKQLSAKEAAQVKWDKNTRKYDWDSWTNGEAWELVKGTDFTIAVTQFSNQARQIARRRGLDISIVQEGTKLTIKFTKHPDATQNGTDSTTTVTPIK